MAKNISVNISAQHEWRCENRGALAAAWAAAAASAAWQRERHHLGASGKYGGNENEDNERRGPEGAGGVNHRGRKPAAA